MTGVGVERGVGVNCVWWINGVYVGGRCIS